MVVIYKITNTENQKVYVGSTNDYKHRKFQHLSELRAREHHNAHLENAWNKYGESKFAFAILETCDESARYKREQHWIDAFDATNRIKGYNIRKRADGHLTHAEETKIKMSIAAKTHASITMRRRWQNPEYCQHMRLLAHTLANDPKHRQKLSAASKASWTAERRRAASEQAKKRQSDPEFKKLMSKSCKGIAKSEATKAKMRIARQARAERERQSRDAA